MHAALDEARKALGRTSPNPAVGCVIVKADAILGRGHHRRAGLPHAEVEALAAVGKKARGSTLYVNLEPCCHTGRTGPCTDAIVAAGVREVVIGMRDPNPLVDGKGIATLERAGVKTRSGVLEPECRRLNEPFAMWVTSGRPQVTLKAAVTLDGKIAPGAWADPPRWITSESAREEVHRMRDR
ncbi:MAG: bifunctional diaminohydroxyphosphoribosylaminopyrimidine deaminase/5-amino-6-(5-phosphoribosylamino)uracil reductase RibD, partial [Stellaceae bacterium]